MSEAKGSGEVSTDSINWFDPNCKNCKGTERGIHDFSHAWEECDCKRDFQPPDDHPYWKSNDRDETEERSYMKAGYKPLEIQTIGNSGLKPALYAMRLPMKSHDKADFNADIELASRLIRAGDEHAKALRGIVVWAEMKFQIGWMVELDTYRVGVETLSTSSTMHIDHKGLKGAELAEAKQANLADVYYGRVTMFSYQALRRIYKQRRSHRHPDWQIFCDWIKTLPYAEELILAQRLKGAANDGR